MHQVHGFACVKLVRSISFLSELVWLRGSRALH
nr:MAG TPA: hypothetical protein [Caudoviricetes sp.]